MARTAVSKRVSTLGGRWGQGVFLNGSSAFSMVDHADFQPTGNFSIAGWFKTRRVASQIIFQSFSQNTTIAGIEIFVRSDKLIQFRSGKNTGTTGNVDYKDMLSAGRYADGLWHHVVGTWDGAYMNLYIDGIAETPLAWANAPAYAATNYVRAGCQNASGSNVNFFTGSLDEIALFNGKALSLSEVQTLYNNELRNTSLFTDPTLKFYSRFNDMTTDDSGNNHPMTAIGSPAPTARRISAMGGRFGNGVLLNGASAFSAVDGVDFKPTGNFSISGWFNSSKRNVVQTFFQSWSKNTNIAGISLAISGSATSMLVNFISGKNTGTVNNTDYAGVTSTIRYNDNNWHHAVGTWDGAKLHLYIDGSEIGTGTVWANAPTFSATNYVRVGCFNDTGTNAGYVTGLLSEVCMFPNDALTLTEIQSLYTKSILDPLNSSIKAKASAIYTFDKNNQLVDSSPNGHTLTAIGSPSVPMIRPSALGGRFGSGVSLNGSSAYSAVDHADFKPTTAFSVGAWIKTSVQLTTQYIFHSEDESVNVAGWSLRVRNSNAITFMSGRNTGIVNGTDYQIKTTLSANAVTDGNWHLVIGVWDGSYLRVFLDGLENGAGVAWANAPDYYSTNNVRVGCLYYSGGSSFKGQLDEVFLFNGYALTASDVLRLYQTELANLPDLLAKPELKFYARFNADNMTLDSSGNGHTMTAIGNPVVTTGRQLI